MPQKDLLKSTITEKNKQTRKNLFSLSIAIGKRDLSFGVSFGFFFPLTHTQIYNWHVDMRFCSTEWYPYEKRYTSKENDFTHGDGQNLNALLVSTEAIHSVAKNIWGFMLFFLKLLPLLWLQFTVKCL